MIGIKTYCRPARPGVTLIELMVVVTILLVLTAASVPMMQPVIADRQAREATRSVNSYLSAAQAKAIESGRPAGVIFERMPGRPGASVDLFMAVSPPPFSGFSIDSRTTSIVIEEFPSQSGEIVTRGVVEFNATDFNLAGSVRMAELVRAGDLIQFNFQGHLYEVTTPVQIGGQIASLRFKHATRPTPKIITTPLPYQIFRRPRKSSASPLQLPGGMVVDLGFSGIGAMGNQLSEAIQSSNAAKSPVLVAFAPGGHLDHISYVGFGEPTDVAPNQLLLRHKKPSSSVYLLVGRIENIPALGVPAEANNLENGSARWLSISHQTGVVSTAENNVLPMANTNPSVYDARQFARDKQTMGGR